MSPEATPPRIGPATFPALLTPMLSNVSRMLAAGVFTAEPDSTNAQHHMAHHAVHGALHSPPQEFSIGASRCSRAHQYMLGHHVGGGLVGMG